MENLSHRMEFVVAYCGERGWPVDPSKLTGEQIAEIRAAFERDPVKRTAHVEVELTPRATPEPER